MVGVRLENGGAWSAQRGELTVGALPEPLVRLPRWIWKEEREAVQGRELTGKGGRR